MLILMVVATQVVNDVRVLREAEALVGAGHCVHIIGRDVPNGGTSSESTNEPGTRIHSASGGRGLRPGASAPQDVAPDVLPSVLARMARWWLLPTHRRLVFRRWAEAAERVGSRIPYDAVHAHDFTALEVGHRLASRRGVPLVYDSHEFWRHRFRVGRPTPLATRRDSRLERRLGARAAAVITVGPALADGLQRAYGWRQVRVVRNTFDMPAESPESLEPPLAAVYAGRIAAGRDLETVARASRDLEFPIRLVGPQDAAWSVRFRPGRCAVEDAVPPEDIDQVLRSAGLALVTLARGSVNHEYALPNKLFAALRAGVPVVASDIGELAATVRDHGVGTLYRIGDAGSLAAAINEARDRHEELVAAVRRARAQFAWSIDREILINLYKTELVR